eukprot:1141767-Pelagomonas_calceolata.AAC.8
MALRANEFNKEIQQAVAYATKGPMTLELLKTICKYANAQMCDHMQLCNMYVLTGALAGGSHLPDITVTSPVFEGGRLAFFVASRGHHTDIGNRKEQASSQND